MQKPTSFFSHSSHDRHTLGRLKDLFISKTGGSIDVFLSSDGESVPFGKNWIHSVEQALERAKLMLVFITPESLRSNWLYFESGYAYSKGVRVVPVSLGVDLASIGAPLNLLQGFNVRSESGLNNIIAVANDVFGHPSVRPILVLCYNRTLAARLAASMEDKGLSDKVHVHNFHAWCTRQLDAYNVDRPKQGAGDAFFADMVDRVIRGVERKAIPAGQYDAVLIDEGHDFEPEWLKLVVQMVNPDSNSLLVLYDDAQAIYGVGKKKVTSFASVGIKARGRTTILKLNYRNTREILAVARSFAEDLLSPRDADEDGAPTVLPVAAGRQGPQPLLIELPTPGAEIERIAEIMREEHRSGTPWADMALLYRHKDSLPLVGDILARRGIPFEMPQKSRRFQPDTVKLLTLHSSNGLEFPLVCITGIGMPHKHTETPEDEARLLYVAMTRATRQLVMTCGQGSQFSEKLLAAMAPA